MLDTSNIMENMEVVGSDSQHVGMVDKVEGNWIRLKDNDVAASGRNHYITLDTVDSIERDRLRLRHTAQDAMHEWQVR